MTPEQYCITQAVKIARQMSYRDSLRFLRGLLLLCGDAPEVAELRAALISASAADAQLQLIAELPARAYRVRQTAAQPAQS